MRSKDVVLGDFTPASPPGLTDRFPQVVGAHVDTVLVNGERLSERAVALRLELEREVRFWERRKKLKPVERRTRPALNAMTMSLVGPYAAQEAPVQALVLVGHPVVSSELPLVGAAPDGRSMAQDTTSADDQGHLMLTTDMLPRGIARLVMQGEVVVGRDRVRTRVFTADHWVRDGADLVPIVWGDATLPLATERGRFVPGRLILGPKARRQLRTASGRDPKFLGWIRDHYGVRTIGDALNLMKRNQHKVDRLVKALRANSSSTGFVVLASDKVLGVELFASHQLMMEFAPRLLHGYLMEAGTKGLRLKRPDSGLESPLMARVTALLDVIPERVTRVVESSREGWPKGLKAVDLRDAGGVIGHGLIHGNQPVHVTLYGE